MNTHTPAPTTSQHTPGPWIYDDEGGFIETGYHDMTGTYGHICDFRKPANAANAAYIVRACNAHEELVKALEIALPELVAYYGKDHFAVAVCKQALALAQQP